jgi:MarR family transcriptional regulator, organic hydroperoxide resistance regulator
MALFERTAGVAMNTTFFGLKRAFHGTLRLTRRALARLGLTAARFDLLYVVLKEGEPMVQRDLQEALGVTAATVSRMLGSLEELGLLQRQPLEEDRRYRSITLTKAGRQCIRRALVHFIRSGYARLALDSALCPDDWYDRLACSRASFALDRTLQRVRDAYGDVATTDYPRSHDPRYDG